MAQEKKLRLSTAPHIHCKQSAQTIMLDVILALLPCAIIGVIYFGKNAARILVLTTLSAVFAEYFSQKVAQKPVRIRDLSAVVTGLILGLNLPPTAPWWLCVVGSVIAIVVVKQLFGGIGHNFMNPAMAARAILLTSWPVRMTSFVYPQLFSQGVDTVSFATPLQGGSATLFDLLIGNVPGCIGEVCKLAILLGAAYLLLRGVIRWYIPVCFVASYLLFARLFGADAIAGVLSGGLLFGAVFMATDYTTTPMTARGQMLFGAGCGFLVALIRSFGTYPEGVTYAILLMNVATPLIDKYVKVRMYGERGRAA
ncbi:MAG: RnfABCDGE type electron transport complex subunit D [Clostridia bacterium]|nr:RnfABCDGE type electron transport complex subunit D [Clostridia bacterium]